MRRIKTSERMLICGKTGTGKTTLARLLTLSIDRLIVVDPKGTLGGSDWDLVDWGPEAERELSAGREYRARFPDPIVDNPDEAYEKLFQFAYYARNITVYIDELYGVTSNGRMGKWLRALYTRGREFNIGVWAATQRPVWIPREALTESEWFFVFRLQAEDDRRRMASDVNPGLLTPVPKADKYGVWMYYIGWEQPLYWKKANPVERKSVTS